MRWLKPGRNNNEDRMNFVKYWANYVKTHPDDVWSKQQNVLINSQTSSARSFKHSRREYLKIKNEPYG